MQKLIKKNAALFYLLGLCFLLIDFSSLHALNETIPLKNAPLSDIDALIVSTEDLVCKQKNLRSKLSEYLKLHTAYLLDMDNRPLLINTANLAKECLDVIKEEKLTPLFESSFISEMTLFAKLAATPSIPKLP